MGIYYVAISGTPQTALIGTAFALPLSILVLDDVLFLPIPGVTVDFTVVNPGVNLNHPSAVTDINGLASVIATAGLTSAVATVQGSVAGGWTLFNTFTLTATDHYVTITQPPVLIDSTYFSMNWQGQVRIPGFWPSLTLGTPSATFPGPYEYGGNLYYVGYAGLEMPHPNPDASGLSDYYKAQAYGPFIALVSSDGGATWALQDITNRPVFYISYAPPNPVVDVTRPVPPVIWTFIGSRVYWSMLVWGAFIGKYAPTSAYAWNAFGYFDLVSGTFSAPTLTNTGWLSTGNGSLAPSQVSLWPYSATAQIGGDLNNYASLIPFPPFVANPDFGKGRLLTQIPGGGETDITPAYFGAWAHTKFEVAVSAVDSNNKLHIIFRTITTPAATQYFYMRLDYGQPIEITATLPTNFPAGLDCNFGNPSFVGADWVVPVRDGQPHFGVVRFANYSQNAPTVTYEPITPPPARPAVLYTTSFAVGSTALVFFVTGTTLSVPRYIYFTDNDGSGWSTPALICDNTILPTLPGDTGNKLFSTISVALLANGDFGFVTATGFNIPAFVGQASVYFAAHITGFQLAQLTVTKVLNPGADPGLFNLLVDGVVQAVDQGNAGTTGPINVSPGTHQAGETAGTGTSLSNYTTVYGGDAAPDGSVVIGAGESKTALITNTRKTVIVRRPRIFGTRRIVILEPNSFDDCLKGLPELYCQIPWDQGVCCVPDQHDYQQWKKFRPDAEPFRSIKAIPTPLAAAGDVLVTTFWPPLGWDGLLHGVFNRYTGPGFRDGGGDLEWRLQFGPAYAKQMGRILVQMGQINKFYKLTQGIPFRSHRPIRFWVYAPNTSGAILPVNSQIICGLEGWIFPRK